MTLWIVNPLAHMPAWAAQLLASPLPTPGTPCASQSAGGYTFDFLGYVNNRDGTTTLSFRVTTTNKKDISHIAFGTGSWTPVAPPNNSSVTGSLGAYHVVWTNTNGNPGFPSIKFEPQFSGFSQGKTDTVTVTVANFTPNTPMLIEAKAGTDKVGVTLALTNPACNLTPTPTPTATPAKATLPAFVPTVVAHTITDADFTTPLSDAAKQALWAQGLPVPATMVAQNKLTATDAPNGVAAAQLAQATTGSGWSSLYTENFDNAFPTAGQQGQCQLAFESNQGNAYQWGGDAYRTFKDSPGAAWPAKGGAAGTKLHPGTDTYPPI